MSDVEKTLIKSRGTEKTSIMSEALADGIGQAQLRNLGGISDGGTPGRWPGPAQIACGTGDAYSFRDLITPAPPGQARGASAASGESASCGSNPGRALPPYRRGGRAPCSGVRNTGLPPEGPSSWAPGQRILARTGRTSAPETACGVYPRKRGSVSAQFLAFDLGAESGRAIRGTAPIRRPRHRRDPPLCQRTGPRARLAALGHPAAVDRHAARARACVGASGLDEPRRRCLGLRLRASSASAGTRSTIPITIATADRRSRWRAVLAGSRATTSTRSRASQFLPFNTLYQLIRRLPADAASARRRLHASPRFPTCSTTG